METERAERRTPAQARNLLANWVQDDQRELLVELVERIQQLERGPSLSLKVNGLEDRLERSEHELHTVQDWISGHIGESRSAPRPLSEAERGVRAARHTETRAASYVVLLLLAIFAAGYAVGLRVGASVE